MILLSAATNALPTNLDLYAEKVFSIVGFIVIPLIAIMLILLVVLMTSFIVGLVLELFGISISIPFISKKRLDKSSKQLVEAFEEVINREDG